jgi:processive 1,2-diacylglycerol beta-glucosyltransferase
MERPADGAPPVRPGLATGPGPAAPRRAVILSGSLGAGHDVLAGIVAGSLAGLGWRSRTLDCMRLLGRRSGWAGEQVFRGLTAVPGAYDALHFASLRSGGRLAAAMDGAARHRLQAALAAELRSAPADLLIPVFAAGVPAAANLATAGAVAQVIVLCPDALAHTTWVREGISLFLVTSAAAAASVRRYLPGARVRVVPPPVRPEFSGPLPAAAARARVGIPPGARCVLIMGGGWGLGPLEELARVLASAGVHVLAVAGRNRRLGRRLAGLAHRDPRVHPFGFTGQIAGLMAACDLVVTLPGALTCAEARAVGRPLMLLDAMPGHGRENLQHELELGGAGVCDPRPARAARAVLAALDRPARPVAGPGYPQWQQAFAAALGSLSPVPLAGSPAGVSRDAAGGPRAGPAASRPELKEARP